MLKRLSGRTASYGFIGGEGSFTRGSSTDAKGVQLSWSFHAEGGDTKLWLSVNDDGRNFNDVKKKWAASFAADGHNLYPWGMELRPIWEVVEQVDAAKGKALKDFLTQSWQRQAHAFRPVNVITSIPRAVEVRGVGRTWVTGHSDLNGVYTLMPGKFCNGKPFYQSNPCQNGYCSNNHYHYSVLYRSNGESGWTVDWFNEKSESCERYKYTTFVHTWGLVCDARCCGRPDCAGRWQELCTNNYHDCCCDAHGIALREVQCSQVCGAHGTVVANAVTCKCSCRDGFTGQRCDIAPRPWWMRRGLPSARGLHTGTTSPHPLSETVAEPEPGNLPELLVKAVAESGGTGSKPDWAALEARAQESRAQAARAQQEARALEARALEGWARELKMTDTAFRLQEDTSSNDTRDE